MIDPANMPAPKFEKMTADLVAQPKECCTSEDGTHFCPARTMRVGFWKHMHVMFGLEVAGSALFVALTPEGARKLASDLLMLADGAEGHLAHEARSRMAAITKGGAA